MAENKQHTNPNNQDDFFKKIVPPLGQSAGDVWESFSDRLTEPTKSKEKKVIHMTWFRAAAAVLLLLISTALVMRYYSVTVSAGKGEHQTCELPDGSIVELNAESSITYHPYWWFADREVELSGEAFFEVAKGKKFTVVSDNGKTEVLGTSFNIYTRNNQYRVFCKTGKVRVTDPDEKVEFIIHPGEMAELYQSEGSIKKMEIEQALAWKNNMFNFMSEPLTFVLKEVERQYDISIEIELDNPEDILYMGYFNKTETVDSTLNLICQTLELTFVKLGESEYKVLQNQ